MTTPDAPAPVLETTGLSLAIGGAPIVSGVSLTVAKGEFLGLIGPNGAGKTSLLNLLSGLRTPTSGTIRLHGKPIDRLAPHQRVRAGLGRTFQSSDLFPALTALENVRLAAQAKLGGSMRLWRRADRATESLDAARACLERVGLSARANLLAGALSHGDKRKLELAILLATGPTVFLLDEPMAGVSAEDVPALTQLIGELCAGHGATVVMVEHHMDVVLALADRLAVMHHGALLACDTPDAVMANATVQSAYVGEAL
ncbi:MAG: ABC transporter ATP-binding protein [Xanthomonadales bacterium]|nr:ABC transporter ATP-binding protein [Xanthomonadales bacterium]ODU94713.1 MAG: ABC transporter ATP-binding protein [Rhodanobacter sp. SCN 66-43]OJY85296.1 MAG: ABC transporter ATP-binding protein [Xanthomonadales bacterium 66-474]